MVQEGQAKLVTVSDDVPSLGFTGDRLLPNAVVQGDAREVMRAVPDESVRLIVTSPPYWDLVDYGDPDQIGQSTYEQYLHDLTVVFKECERALIPNGKICINTPIVPVPKQRSLKSRHTRELKNLNNDIEAQLIRETSLDRFSLFVWQKQTTVKMFGSYPFPPNIYENNSIEFINILVKPGVPPTMPAAVKDANKLTQRE